MWEALMPLLSSTQIMTDAIAQAIIGTVNQLSRRRSELVALSRAERVNQSTAEPASKIRSCCTQMWCITAALTLKLLSTITQHSMLNSHNFHPCLPRRMTWFWARAIKRRREISSCSKTLLQGFRRNNSKRILPILTRPLPQPRRWKRLRAASFAMMRRA